MMRTKLGLGIGLIMVIVALCAQSAAAAQLRTFVRLKGHQSDPLNGFGLVVGLNGTGDKGKDGLVTARPLAELLRNYRNPVASAEELLKVDSVAIVSLSVKTPPGGFREGDTVDVRVDALYNASSLAGGTLITSFLYLPGRIEENRPPFAMASGQIVVEGDNPRSGMIRGGGQMLLDHRTNVLQSDGSITLVLHSEFAAYPEAAALAAEINEWFGIDGYETVARVEDVRNIKVTLPKADRANPAEFLGQLMLIPIDISILAKEPRIAINRETGVIAVTGNVEIGPVAISHDSIAITTRTPPQPPTAATPEFRTSKWAGLDMWNGENRNSANLNDLIAALEQLDVPVEDQIDIIYELKNVGAIHAEIVESK